MGGPGICVKGWVYARMGDIGMDGVGMNGVWISGLAMWIKLNYYKVKIYGLFEGKEVDR